MSNHDPLRDALRHRADQLGDSHPLTLDDVKGRARGIRRRRNAVSGLAAAAVLAVAVPVGIAVTDRMGTDPDVPPVAGPSVSPSEADPSESTPVPAGPHQVTLTTDVDGTSDAPGIPYLYDGGIRQGEYFLDLGEDYDSFAPVDLGWAATRQDDEANRFVDLLDSEGEVIVSAPSTGSLAVSEDGTVVAYATPEGELVTVTSDAERTSLVPPEALPSGILDPVAVLGSQTCDPDSSGGGCVVFFNSSDAEEQRAWSATSKGIVSPFPDFRWLTGLAPDNSPGGVVSVAEDTSTCSAVLGPDWDKQAWKTCDYRTGQFSPDGRYVIGHPTVGDGRGDTSVAILDARTGDLLAEFRNSEEHPSFVSDVVWDDDNTLLATVFEDGWSLMRMTADGELTTVRADLGDDPDDVPLRLATQP